MFHLKKSQFWYNSERENQLYSWKLISAQRVACTHMHTHTIRHVKRQKNITQWREKSVDKNKVTNEPDSNISRRKHQNNCEKYDNKSLRKGVFNVWRDGEFEKKYEYYLKI